MFRFSQPAPVSARIVRRNETPCLLVAFNASSPPLVWQLDLEKLSNDILTLRETNGEWDLGLLPPQGPFASVAHFDERGDAEYAYEKVRAALVKGEPKPLFYGFRWGLGLTVAFFVFLIATNLLHLGAPASDQTQGAQQAQMEEPLTVRRTPPQLTGMGLPPGLNSESSGPKEIETGVPVSADDVLPKQ